MKDPSQAEDEAKDPSQTEDANVNTVKSKPENDLTAEMIKAVQDEVAKKYYKYKCNMMYKYPERTDHKQDFNCGIIGVPFNKQDQP